MRGRSKVHPFTLVRTMPNAPGCVHRNDARAPWPCAALQHDVLSSSVAIGEAARQIRHGYVDVMIAGGTETLLTYSAVNCWQSAQLLAPLHEDPARSCRPFDAHAQRRGAGRRRRVRRAGGLGPGRAPRGAHPRRSSRLRVHGRLRHTSRSHPWTARRARCRQRAGRRRNRPASDWLRQRARHRHPAQRRRGDAGHQERVRRLMRNASPSVRRKSMVGHMVGASGAIGVLMCVKALRTQHVPPTANLRRSRSGMRSRLRAERRSRHARAWCRDGNAFGFGGTAACAGRYCAPLTRRRNTMQALTSDKQAPDRQTEGTARVVASVRHTQLLAGAVRSSAFDLLLFAALSVSVVVATAVVGGSCSRPSARRRHLAHVRAGHDAWHQSLTPSRRLNAWLGRIVFLPTYVVRDAVGGRSQCSHHGFTGLRGRDIPWVPLSPEQYVGLSRGGAGCTAYTGRGGARESTTESSFGGSG